MGHKNKRGMSKGKFKNSCFLIGFASLFWLLFRTGTKPSRIVYPCQRAALANSCALLNVPIVPFLVMAPRKARRFLSKEGAAWGLLLITVSALILSGITLQPARGDVNPAQEITLSLNSSTATELPASDIFVVNGRTYAHISELADLMGSHGLLFYKSGTTGRNQGPDGLIARDDVVLIKTNCQWSERGGTNTDLLKELIQMIISHPDGFVGEIIVADNGQAQYGSSGNGGSLNWANNNAEDHSQSAQDVVDMFSASYNVSTYLWDTITLESVSEYSEGDMNDGYVVNQTANPATGIKVSYPKFKTKFSTYVSFKKGIWDNVTQSYDNERLKVINFPVLKSHSVYGVTASVKHYMGVTSAKQTNAHASVAKGGMGTEMIETRFPTLNILDAIWVNANPGPSSYCGPGTLYYVATRVNVIMASTDPVALDYWAAKHVLVQAASVIGYDDTHTLDPDNTDKTGVSGEAFGIWLNLSKDAIVTAGYQSTTEESHMNVYVAQAVHDSTPPDIDTPSQNPPTDNVMPGQEVQVSANVTDAESGVKNVTLFYTINNGPAWENRTMNYNASTSLYEAKILGQPPGTGVKYRITAYDNAENQAVNDNAGEYYVYTVIPEFLSFLILPLFMLATLLVAIIYRKKIFCWLKERINL